jgi:phage gpG-like protein
MSNQVLHVTTTDLAKVSHRLELLLHRLHDLQPFMAKASVYMLNSSKHRIRQGTTSPNGEKFAGLSSLTKLLKGHDKPLYQSGGLYRGTSVTQLTPTSFTIETRAERDGVKSGKRNYAPDVQGGTPRPKGMVRLPNGRVVFPRKSIPARPFLGFSQENISRLSKMLTEFIEKQ